MPPATIMSNTTTSDDDYEPGAGEPASWFFRPSQTGLGSWLTFFGCDVRVMVLAPPGVPIAEEWDDERLLGWRVAIWNDCSSFEDNAIPLEIRHLSGLPEALALVPDNALAESSAHAWMVGATEAHADAIERLAMLQEHQSGDGVADAAARLRRVARSHREQAARCLTQPPFLLTGDRSAHEVAQVVVNQPNSVPALIDRDLNREPHLSMFVAALNQIEREHGEQSVRDALTGLLFAKHYSSSWKFTGHVREARRSTRRAVRSLRRLASEQLLRVRSNDSTALAWVTRHPVEPREHERPFSSVR